MYVWWRGMYDRKITIMKARKKVVSSSLFCAQYRKGVLKKQLKPGYCITKYYERLNHLKPSQEFAGTQFIECKSHYQTQSQVRYYVTFALPPLPRFNQPNLSIITWTLKPNLSPKKVSNSSITIVRGANFGLLRIGLCQSSHNIS